MKEGKKTSYYFRLNVLVWILLGSMFCLIGIGVFINPIGTDDDTGVYSNGIQFATLFFTVASVLYLIKNFQQQQEQIEEQRREGEFNRVMSLIYQHLPITEKKSKHKILLTEITELDKKLGYDFHYLNIQIGKDKRYIDENVDDIIRFLNNLKNLLADIKFYSIRVRKLLNIYVMLIYNRNFEQKQITELSYVIRDAAFNDINNNIDILSGILWNVAHWYSTIAESYEGNQVVILGELNGKQELINELINEIQFNYHLFPIVNHPDFMKTVELVRKEYNV